MISPLVPLGLLFAVVVGFVATNLVATHLLGPKRTTLHKGEAFECGVDSVGNARSRFSVHYFLLAILFVLFDVELIFFYPWAVNFRSLGLLGFVEMVLFILAVCVGFFYLVKNNVLDFSQKSVYIRGIEKKDQQ